MKIEIFDVEHGQCSVITCPNGKRIMIDCGNNTSTGWNPSDHFKGQNIESLIITNYDRDHTSDFNGVMQKCNVRYILGNHTINAYDLAEMKKEYGMSSGIQGVHKFLQRTNWATLSPAAFPDLGEVGKRSYWNPYPYFTDANNLSVATFIEYAGFCILFPGDLEVAGWNEIIKQSGFKERLAKVDILVAAHHGRENGFSTNAFQYMSPAAVVISDCGVEYATQETVQLYRAQARGCVTTDKDTRRVLTTRSDGKIEIYVNANGTYDVALKGKTVVSRPSMFG